MKKLVMAGRIAPEEITGTRVKTVRWEEEDEERFELSEIRKDEGEVTILTSRHMN